MCRFWLLVSALACVVSACAPGAREYELHGVVVAVDAPAQEITIKHDDIPRFMPGMTMPFKVRDPQLLSGRAPGDVVRATLVVKGADAHLRTLERTGTAPVPEGPPPLARDTLEPGAAAPDAMLVDQHGVARRVSTFRGQALAVTFVYTRCPIPNFCPLMDRHFKSTQESIRQDPELRGRVRLLSVSFDPEYDRPRVLAARARELSADPEIWSFLTGERAEVERFASRFGVSIVERDAGANITHNLRTAVIDPEGKIVAILRGNEWSPEELTGRLRDAVGRR
jgi:protein SCO1/2